MRLKNNYYILRHGQTNYQANKSGFAYPRADSPKVKLTKKGAKQVRIAAGKLKREDIDLIYSSDFYRTRQTAKIAARELGQRVFFDQRLRDIDLGTYHGGPKKYFHRDFPLTRKKVFFKKTPQGESWSECQKRMVNFLKEIDRKYKRKIILIISHGDPLWLLEGALKNWSWQKMAKIKSDKTGYIKAGEFRKL
jgi:broad specificity phosphatase PhoE